MLLVFSFFLGSLKAFASNVQSSPLPLCSNPREMEHLSVCKAVSSAMVSIGCCHLDPASSILWRGRAVLSPLSWTLSPTVQDIMDKSPLPHLCEECPAVLSLLPGPAVPGSVVVMHLCICAGNGSSAKWLRTAGARGVLPFPQVAQKLQQGTFKCWQ